MINQNGIQSIDKFIEKALYDKNFGYYTRNNPFGKKGDFVTAPLISPLFSEMIAVWAISFWIKLGKPKKFSFVELGPGTGVITDEIIKRLKPNTQLLVIELNDTFYMDLKSRISDPRVTIKKGCATELSRFINILGMEKADYVVSSLPLAILPHILRKRIVIDINTHLKPNGSYIQFQYTLQSLKIFKKVFKKVSIKHCLLNVPPAFVYTCKSK